MGKRCCNSFTRTPTDHILLGPECVAGAETLTTESRFSSLKTLDMLSPAVAELEVLHFVHVGLLHAHGSWRWNVEKGVAICLLGFIVILCIQVSTLTFRYAPCRVRVYPTTQLLVLAPSKPRDHLRPSVCKRPRTLSVR